MPDEHDLGYLQRDVKLLHKRLDVAQHGAVLTYDQLSHLFSKAIKDTEHDHPKWARVPSPFADSARKRFMGLVVNQIRNNPSKKDMRAIARKLLREGVTPEQYAELAQLPDQDQAWEGWDAEETD
jgi:hypothetical protein